MDLFLAICEALGLGLAAGLGGPLAWLFIAVMAGLQAGIDPRGTDSAFIGEIWFIGLLLVANVLELLRPNPRDRNRRRVAVAVAAVFGAVFGSAALAAEGESTTIGFLIGGLAGIGAALVASDLLSGAQARIEAGPEAGSPVTLGLILGAAGVLVAVLALFLPPSSLLVAGLLAALVISRRRKADQKYQGLRILR